MKTNIRSVIFVLFAIFGFSLLPAANAAPDMKATVLTDLNKPDMVVVDKTQMYIAEGTSIYIYSLTDFKLVKTFGKEGQGPQEFTINRALSGLVLDVDTDHIIVSSMTKVSWFNKDGTFVKEMKKPSPFVVAPAPFGQNWVSFSVAQEGKKNFFVLNAYDDKFSKIKELYRVPHFLVQGQGLRLYERPLLQRIYKDKLYIAWADELEINVLDLAFKTTKTIKQAFKRPDVTDADKKKTEGFYKNDPQLKNFYPFFKPLHFPKQFPAIQDFYISDGKIYVITFKTTTNGSKTLCLVFNTKGKFLKSVHLPLVIERPQPPYHHVIGNGNLYRVFEDEENEEWNVRVDAIK